MFSPFSEDSNFNQHTAALKGEKKGAQKPQQPALCVLLTPRRNKKAALSSFCSKLHQEHLSISAKEVCPHGLPELLAGVTASRERKRLHRRSPGPPHTQPRDADPCLPATGSNLHHHPLVGFSERNLLFPALG